MDIFCPCLFKLHRNHLFDTIYKAKVTQQSNLIKLTTETTLRICLQVTFSEKGTKIPHQTLIEHVI